MIYWCFVTVLRLVSLVKINGIMNSSKYVRKLLVGLKIDEDFEYNQRKWSYQMPGFTSIKKQKQKFSVCMIKKSVHAQIKDYNRGWNVLHGGVGHDHFTRVSNLVSGWDLVLIFCPGKVSSVEVPLVLFCR